MSNDRQEDDTWKKLPPEEKVKHSNWRARLEGYQEAQKIFEKEDEKSPVFDKYLGVAKKFIVDSNAPAQEKGVEAMQSFVRNAAVAKKTAGECTNAIVTKCFNARQKTKEMGIELLMLYIEIEKQDVVIEELIKGCTNKQDKIARASIYTIKEAMRQFGPKIISPKPVVKILPGLLEAKDAVSRDEAKDLAVVLYHWLGDPALKSTLGAVKPVLQNELQGLFEEVKSTKPQKLRFLKSEQEKIDSMPQAEGSQESSAGPEIPVEEEIDPLAFINPVDISKDIPKDWSDQLASKKWSERKEIIEKITSLAEANPKLEYTDIYKDIVPALKKVISKDVNVMCVTAATKCVGLIANGLGKKFSIFVQMLLEAILDKFKEKKAAVIAELRTTIDAVSKSTSLEAMSESCINHLSHKNPDIRLQTSAFLARSFQRATKATLPKKLLKNFVEALCANLNDSAETREASYEALGTCMKVVGEKAVEAFIPDNVEDIKKEKIRECGRKIVLNNSGKSGGGQVKNGTSKTSTAESAPSQQSATAVPKKVPMKGSRTGGVSKPSSGIKKSDAKRTDKKKSEKKENSEQKDGAIGFEERVLSDGDVESLVSAFGSSDTITNLSAQKYSDRQAAVDDLTEKVVRGSRESIPCQAILNVLSRKPGMQDCNHLVMKSKLKLVEELAANANFSKISCDLVLDGVIDQLGQPKNSQRSREALFAMGDALGFNYISSQIVEQAVKASNPNKKAESLNTLNSGIELFGIKSVQVQSVVELLKNCFQNNKANVRQASYEVAATLLIYTDDMANCYFQAEPDRIKTEIKNTRDKQQGRQKLPPSRGKLSAAAATGAGADGNGAARDEDDDEEEPMEMNVPRTDIISSLNDELMQKLTHQAWKEKNAAVDSLFTILKANPFIKPNLGDLPNILNERLKESNKNMVAKVIEFIIALTAALGSGVKEFGRIWALNILLNYGDRKPTLRQSAIKAMNDITNYTKVNVIFENEIIFDALKPENPILKSEIMKWLTEKLSTCKKPPVAELKLIVPNIYSCLEDRNADVRQASNSLLTPLLKIIGFDGLKRLASKLSKGSQQTVLTILQKVKENLPVQTKPVAKASVKVEDKPEPPSTSSNSLKSGKSRENVSEETSEKPTLSTKSKLGKIKAPTAKSRTSAKEPKPEAAAYIKETNEKTLRMKDEKNRKTLRWDFSGNKAEYIKQLKNQMEGSFSREFIDILFHATDFKIHVKGIEILHKNLNEEPLSLTLSNLDLILRYFTIRFQENNTTVLIKIFDYCDKLFSELLNSNYVLLEYEAYSFLPFLIHKIGDTKDNIKKAAKSLVQKSAKMYSPFNICKFVVDGLTSKNLKFRAECVDQIGMLIQENGMQVCYPNEKTLMRSIAEQIALKDHVMREYALNAIVTAVQYKGRDAIMRHLTDLPQATVSMIEERLKRTTIMPKTEVRSQSPKRQNRTPSPKPKSKHINSSLDHLKNVSHSQSSPPTGKKRSTSPERSPMSNLQRPATSPASYKENTSPVKRQSDANERENFYLQMKIEENVKYVAKETPKIPSRSAAIEQALRKKERNAIFSLTEVGLYLSKRIDKLDITDITKTNENLKEIAATVEAVGNNDMQTVYRRLAPCLIAATGTDFDRAAKKVITSNDKPTVRSPYLDYCQYLIAIFDEILNYNDILKSIEKKELRTIVRPCLEILGLSSKVKTDNVKSLVRLTQHLLSGILFCSDIEIFLRIIHDWISFKVNEDYLPDSGSTPVQPVLKFLASSLSKNKSSGLKIVNLDGFITLMAEFQKLAHEIPESIAVKQNAIIEHFLHIAYIQHGQTLMDEAESLLPADHEIISKIAEAKATPASSPSDIKKQLAKIFKLFSSKDTMDEAARELLKWTDRNPGVDIWKYTEGPDEQFKRFIDQKLARLKLESRSSRPNKKLTCHTLPSKYQKNPHFKMQRLLMLKKRIDDVIGRDGVILPSSDRFTEQSDSNNFDLNEKMTSDQPKDIQKYDKVDLLA